MNTNAINRYYSFLKYGYVVALASHFIFIALFRFINIDILVYFNIFSILIYIIALIMLHKGFQNSSLILVSSEIIAHACLAVSILGWQSGFHYYLYSLMMVSAFNPIWHVMTKIIYTGLISVAYLILEYYTSNHLASIVIDDNLLHYMQETNIILSFAFIGYLAHVYVKSSIHAEDKLLEMATTDPLTGLYNRREFAHLFDIELIKNRRNQIPFSLIMVDVDNFKMINDTYGHQCGDDVLVALSKCFSQSIREQDYVARWGGEEFIFLLPETDMEGAIVLAEKLYDAVKSVDFSCDKNHRLTVTLSVGEHQFHETRDQLIVRVDTGLLKGKEGGKNQIICV